MPNFFSFLPFFLLITTGSGTTLLKQNDPKPSLYSQKVMKAIFGVNSNKEEAVSDEKEHTCVRARTSFCPVTWNVRKPSPFSTSLDASDKELLLESWLNASLGSLKCKIDFKNLHCAYSFPKCTQAQPEIYPCRSDCEQYTKYCPGTDLACNSYPADDDVSNPCYHVPLLNTGAFVDATQNLYFTLLFSLFMIGMVQ